MRIFNYRDFKDDFFGSHRFFDILKPHTQCHNEIFFSIERRLPQTSDEIVFDPHKLYGYMTLTDNMKCLIRNELFTGCNGIKFIEWAYSWNVVFEESTILGGISFEISKDEFNRIFPDFETRYQFECSKSTTTREESEEIEELE